MDARTVALVAELTSAQREIERLSHAVMVERGKLEKADEDNERLRELLLQYELRSL